MPTAEVSVAADPRSAGVARRFLREALAGWDAAVYIDAAELVLTELVTNAVLHAKTDIVVRVDLGRGGLRLEVIDGSPRQPIARHYSPEATTGRGLGLVDAVAERWGVQPGQDGKTVWAELASDHASLRSVPDPPDAERTTRSNAGDDGADHSSGVGASGAGPSERSTGLLRTRVA